VFGIILLSVVTLMHVYVLWRADSLPFLKRRISRKELIGAGIVLWSVFFSRPLSWAWGHRSLGHDFRIPRDELDGYGISLYGLSSRG
jgi:hypothetical protein